ncbi:MAG TPA: hypothetical protein VMY38_06055 [Gemmatimonadaceae bacterium]|nr:hypothetical protein [Gemmatimonadaceae bacterium]
MTHLPERHMTDSLSHPSARRRFLAQLSGAAAAFAGFALPDRAGAATGPGPDHDAWMQRARGRHRQFFHSTGHGDGAAMLMATNFLDVYGAAYATAPTHVSAVIGVHGTALPIGLSNAAWDKYELGKVINVNDPDTKVAARRNVFAVGGPISIDTAMRRGIVLLVCNIALTRLSNSLAGSLSLPQADVYNDLRSSVIPGAIVVPGLVVAINRAQERGFTYVRAS